MDAESIVHSTLTNSPMSDLSPDHDHGNATAAIIHTPTSPPTLPPIPSVPTITVQSTQQSHIHDIHQTPSRSAGASERASIAPTSSPIIIHSISSSPSTSPSPSPRHDSASSVDHANADADDVLRAPRRGRGRPRGSGKGKRKGQETGREKERRSSRRRSGHLIVSKLSKKRHKKDGEEEANHDDDDNDDREESEEEGSGNVDVGLHEERRNVNVGVTNGHNHQHIQRSTHKPVDDDVSADAHSSHASPFPSLSPSHLHTRPHPPIAGAGVAADSPPVLAPISVSMRTYESSVAGAIATSTYACAYTPGSVIGPSPTPAPVSAPVLPPIGALNLTQPAAAINADMGKDDDKDKNAATITND